MIDSQNKEKDNEIIVSFLEGITELRKNQIGFDLRIKSGSLDVYVEILKDIFENPAVAQSTAKAIGIIMQKAFDNKDFIRYIPNKLWKFGEKLQRLLNKKRPEEKLSDIRRNYNTIIVKFTDNTNGNNISYSYDLDNSEAVFTNYNENQEVMRNEENIPNPGEAYCVKCRAKRRINNAKLTKLKNGRPAVKGICPVCGTNMFRIGKPE